MRYLRLLAIFYRNSLYAEMEYRANFIASALMSLFWVAFAWLGVHLFYFHRDQIGGWQFHQAMVVVGMFTLFNGIIEALLRPNVTRIVEQIRLGTFDFVLVKPVNSQFMASLRYLSVWKLVDLLLGLAIVAWAVHGAAIEPAVADILMALGFVVNGTVIVYSIWVLMVSTAFWFVRVDNITELFTSAFETGRFPVSVYPGWLRGVLTFVVPIAFVTTFPAEAILGRAQLDLLALSCLLAAASLGCSAVVWRYAVRHYSSASS
jgi:ABC-2 type transport system permease protein